MIISDQQIWNSHRSKYDVNFYKQFVVVMNALDNRNARSHVNRMCLAANIPLIESGSSGTLGHVTVFYFANAKKDLQPIKEEALYVGLLGFFYWYIGIQF